MTHHGTIRLVSQSDVGVSSPQCRYCRLSLSLLSDPHSGLWVVIWNDKADRKNSQTEQCALLDEITDRRANVILAVERRGRGEKYIRCENCSGHAHTRFSCIWFGSQDENSHSHNHVREANCPKNPSEATLTRP